MSCPIRGWDNLMKYVLEGKSTQDNIHHSFWRLNLISGERVAAEVVKSQFRLSFLAIERHFVRKGCRGSCEIAISPQFFGDRTSFRAKGLPRKL